MLFLVTNNDMTDTVLMFSYIGLGVFSILLILFIGLHLFWTKRCKRNQRLEQSANTSLFRFLKVNIFAFFAAIWGCGLFSAIMALIAMR